MGSIGETEKNYHAHSLIDDRDHVLRANCAKFLFIVPTHIIYQDAGRYDDNAGIPLIDNDYWDVDGWFSADRDAFETAFRDKIQKAFGDGNFWLYHKKKGTKDFWCDVWIDFVKRENAKLVVRALMNPRRRDGSGHWRNNCIPIVPGGGVDMKIEYKRVVGKDRDQESKTSDRGTQTFYQSTVVHEFGHYMFLPHTCATWKKIWQANSNPAYCEGQPYAKQNDLMAIGNTLAAWHGFAFKLRLMGFHGFALWSPELYLATDRNKAPWT